MTMWLWLTLAVAGSESWTLADEVWLLDEPVAIERPTSDIALERGWVFRIDRGDEPVGALIVGEGTWSVAFETRSDAVVAANRMVVLEGADPEPLRSVVAGLQLDLSVDRGLILGNDVWASIEPSLLEVKREQGTLFSTKDGVEEVVVAAFRSPGEARRLAKISLKERTEWIRTHLFDPDSLLVVDAWDGRSDVWFGDFRTDRAWDMFAGADSAGPDVRWLSVIEEPNGVFDATAGAQVFAAIATDTHFQVQPLAKQRFDLDDQGHPRSPVRIDAIEAAARHALVPEDSSQVSLLKESVVDVAIEAVGLPQQVVWIDVPHVHQQPWNGEGELANGWTLDGISLRGGPELQAVHVPLTPDQIEGRGNHRTMAVRLPTPLQPGERATLRVRYTDRHRYHRVLDTNNADPENFVRQVYELGTNTNLVRALPQVRGTAQSPFRADVEVGLPESLGHRAVISGGEEQIRTQDRWSWWRVRSASRSPVFAAGAWSVHDRRASHGLPGVQVAVRDGGEPLADNLARHVVQLVELYEQVLPDYPFARVQVAELVAPAERLMFQSGSDGMIGLGSTQERVRGLGAERFLRNRVPQLEFWALATGLNHQWWLARGLTDEGKALAELVGPAYATSAVEVMYGTEDADTWVEHFRRCASPADRRLVPLHVRAGESACSGAHLISRGLPGRIGGSQTLEAIDRVMTGEHPATFAGLQAALEQVGNTDLQGFFDVWVHGGLAPDVAVTWSFENGRVLGRATTNLPFGTLEVPVRIEAGDEAVDARITIEDGTATFSIPWTGAQPEAVRIDPDETLLFRNTQSVAQAMPMG